MDDLAELEWEQAWAERLPHHIRGWFELLGALKRLALGQVSFAQQLHALLDRRMELLAQRRLARQVRQLPAVPEPVMQVEAQLLEESEQLLAEWPQVDAALLEHSETHFAEWYTTLVASGRYRGPVRPSVWPQTRGRACVGAWQTAALHP